MAKEKKVMPNDKVKIKWTNSKYHEKNSISEVHPEQAKKLVAKKVAEYVSKKDANTAAEEV